MLELLASAGKKEVVPKTEVFDFPMIGELFERIRNGDAVGRFVLRAPE